MILKRQSGSNAAEGPHEIETSEAPATEGNILHISSVSCNLPSSYTVKEVLCTEVEANVSAIGKKGSAPLEKEPTIVKNLGEGSITSGVGEET